MFSWITYKSRAQRDRINAKVMADPRLKSMMDGKSMPFDGKRMICGRVREPGEGVGLRHAAIIERAFGPAENMAR